MNAKQELAAWLSSKKKDYKKGVKIFIALQVDPKSERFFNQAPTAMHRNMLLNKLTNYARVYGTKSAKPKVKPASKKAKKVIIKHVDDDVFMRPHIEEHPSIKREDLPDDMKELFDANKADYDLYNQLSIELRNLPEAKKNDNKRKEFAEQIVNLKKANRERWDKIDNWFNNQGKESKPNQEKIEPSGKLTLEQIEAIEDIEIKTLSKQKRIEANLNYLRRYRDSDSEKTQAKVAARIKELEKWKVDYEEILSRTK